MSAPLIILASLPSFCQKSSKLVGIWQSSDKYKFAQFFWRHGVDVAELNSIRPINVQEKAFCRNYVGEGWHRPRPRAFDLV